MKTVAIIGASGAIGSAFARNLAARMDVRVVHAFSRSARSFNSEKIVPGYMDLTDEPSIAAAAEAASSQGPLNLVIVATGMLHTPDLSPENPCAIFPPKVPACLRDQYDWPGVGGQAFSSKGASWPARHFRRSFSAGGQHFG